MSTYTLFFPEGFLWGAATAAHQNEGNNTNNDFWAWEQTPGHVVDNTTSGLAADWWNRAEADFDRAAEMGLNTLRLSVEWSRLEPEPGNWDEDAFERYRQMLQGLQQRNIKPMVTLHHFTNPLWLAEIGGWTNKAVISHFQRFTTKVVNALGDQCDLWATINEPNIYAAHAYILGKWHPGHTSLPQFIQVTRHQIRAHAAAYKAIKHLQPHSQVGIVQHLAAFDPATNSPLDRAIADLRSQLLNWYTLDAVVLGFLKFPYGTRYDYLETNTDFIGINYYGRHPLRFSLDAADKLFAAEVEASPEIAWPPPWTDREIYPDGLYRFIVETARRYGKPIYVTENGMADPNDNIRPGFLLTHLAAIHRAIRAGVDVRGYYHWTLVDNYEWVEGWTTPFGLIALDPATQERSPRPSADLYATIVKSGTITDNMVKQYAPQVSVHL